MMFKIKSFLKSELISSVLLIIITILALIIANSPINYLYQYFFYFPLDINVGKINICKPFIVLINDGLMTIFFLFIGLEVKRELIEGVLSTPKKAIFPIFAAFGGILIPAMIYLFLNSNNNLTKNGWGIPIATDIAFTLGILKLLGTRVPRELKTFLLTLAIFDDLVVIIIIAFFYTKYIHIFSLMLAIFFLLVLICLNLYKIELILIYLFIGIILWICILYSGIHATIAGVIISFIIPLKGLKNNISYKKLENILQPLVAYFILPLFVFANAGIPLSNISSEDFTSTLLIGVVLSLVCGKPMGIFFFSWLSLKIGIAKLPTGINMKQIFAISVLCGIGFTMSIFITGLTFNNVTQFINHALLGILISFIISAICGIFLLNIILPKKNNI